MLRACGLDPRLFRHAPLARRIPACLRALGVASVDEARTLLAAHPCRLRAAVNALLVGVTEFFRDGAVFDALRTQGIPALRRRGRPIRVWSAGASSGAELYSAAILLAEAGLLDGSELVGTDCRAEAVLSARAGVFDAAIAASLPSGLRERYFEAQAQGAWRAHAVLRSSVRFDEHDLCRAALPGPWDIILCRNVTIYLLSSAGNEVQRKLESELAPGGYLVLGRAERPASSGLRQIARGLYQRADTADV